MLFLGLIARKLVGGDNNNKDKRPAFVGVPTESIPCNCRGDQYCPQCPQHMPVMAAAPAMPRHCSRRQWKHERHAIREARRAVRHGYGYGYGYPAGVAVPVASPPFAGDHCSHDEDCRDAGPSSRPRLEDRRNRRSTFDGEYLDEEQGEDLPPKYERGDWEPSRRSVGGQC